MNKKNRLPRFLAEPERRAPARYVFIARSASFRPLHETIVRAAPKFSPPSFLRGLKRHKWLAPLSKYPARRDPSVCPRAERELGAPFARQAFKTRKLSARSLAALLAAALATGAAPAADPKPAPTTHTIAKGTLKPKVQLDAVFESIDMTPVKLETKAWTDLTVIEAVPHGARVKRGETLVKLDTEKIAEQIKEQEQDAPAAVIALETAVAELANLEETTPLKLEAARRTHRVANEELV